MSEPSAPPELPAPDAGATTTAAPPDRTDAAFAGPSISSNDSSTEAALETSSASTADRQDESDAATPPMDTFIPAVDTASDAQPPPPPLMSAAAAPEAMADTTNTELDHTTSAVMAVEQPTTPPPQSLSSAPSSSSASKNLPSAPPSDSPPSPARTLSDVKASPASASASSLSLKDAVSPPQKQRSNLPTTAATSPSTPPSSDPLSSPVKTVKPSPAPIQSPPLSAAKAPSKSPVTTKPAPPRVTPVKTSLPASATASAAATPVAPSPLPFSTPSSAPPAYPLPSNIQLALLAKTQGETDAYGNTTRCICHDNSNSDGFMLSCDTCIAEGTPVALRYGLAVPIEAVTARGCEVLAVQEADASGAMGRSVVDRGAVGTNVKGERAVCRMWLANGRYLDLTDDHPVFVRGKRRELPVSRPVKELKTGWRHALNTSEVDEATEDEVAMVMMGVDSAVDDCRLDTEEERSWSLSLGDSSLPPVSFSPLPPPLPPSSSRHFGASHRDRALAFARVLGYVTGCGRLRLCTPDQQLQPTVSVAFQHWLDADEWVKDISLIMGNIEHSSHKQMIRAGRRGRWWVTLPQQLSAALCRLIGREERTCQGGAIGPPAFFDCTLSRLPTAFIREYLAALFGAVGRPMRCRRPTTTADGGIELQPAVTLALSSHKSTFTPLSLLLPHISSLLSSLGIDRSQQRLTHRGRAQKASRSSTASARLPLSLSSLHVACPIAFCRLLSYRYAAFKQLRLSVACAYLHYRNNITQQRLNFPASLCASHSPSFVSRKWAKHIDSAIPALHTSSSPLEPLRLATFSHFLSTIGLPSLFTSFSLPPTATSLPAYFLPIVALEPLPSPLPVYDLSMQAGQSPSFLASSVFVHNCEVWQHGDCFPEADTRVLTSCGLLFLDEIEERLAEKQEVLFGCYEVASKQLLYVAGKLVYSAPPQQWVEFTSEGESARWTGASSPYGTEGAGDDALQSRHVSLRVTPGHSMFVQTGNQGIVAWRPRNPDTRTNSSSVPQPYRVVKAKSLLSEYDSDCDSVDSSGDESDCEAPPGKLDCKHRRAHVRMLACAEHGYKPHMDTTRRQAVQLQLHLDIAQFTVFVELLGFWLGDGAPQHNSVAATAVRFSHVKQTDRVWLRAMLRKVGLGPFSAAPCASGTEECVNIVDKAWCAYFQLGVWRRVDEALAGLGAARTVS